MFDAWFDGRIVTCKYGRRWVHVLPANLVFGSTTNMIVTKVINSCREAKV